ncbi:DUF6273 domain-containing protein [Sporosarcina contaminans]|uniref:DUF6273 domain-containing protein n=1 Tax=Sporosarcina contaminans TaxID=633403 RepID=A0ABW3TS31_9BACL
MTTEKITPAVQKALAEIHTKIAEIYEKNWQVPLKEQPTEVLIGTMESIIFEIKLRMGNEKTQALHELPVGAKIRDKNTKYYGAPVVWLVADHGYYGPTQSMILAERILAFKAFDAREPNNPDERRADWGNNEYQVSNIGLWLNSYKDDWFTPLHEYDQAPTAEHVYGNPYADEKGFLANFSEEFIQQINDSVQGKVFLLSAGEVGLSDDGKPLAIFTDDDSRKAYPTPECTQNDNEGDPNEADWWWLRTPHAGHSSSARSVNTSGVISHSTAYVGISGVRPALNLPSEIRVTAEPDENGIYDIVWGS